MGVANERDKLVKSVARYIAGLKPKRGIYSYYFGRYRNAVIDKVIKLRDGIKGLKCPFCGRVFRRRGSLVTHIIYVHYHDVLSLFD